MEENPWVWPDVWPQVKICPFTGSYDELCPLPLVMSGDCCCKQKGKAKGKMLGCCSKKRVQLELLFLKTQVGRPNFLSSGPVAERQAIAATFFETRSKFEGLDCLECNAKQSKQWSSPTFDTHNDNLVTKLLWVVGELIVSSFLSVHWHKCVLLPIFLQKVIKQLCFSTFFYSKWQ